MKIQTSLSFKIKTSLSLMKIQIRVHYQHRNTIFDYEDQNTSFLSQDQTKLLFEDPKP